MPNLKNRRHSVKRSKYKKSESKYARIKINKKEKKNQIKIKREVQ